MIIISGSRLKGKTKSGTMKLQTKENLAGYSFLALNFIGYIAFKLIPLILALGLSVTKWNFASGFKNMEFVGLGNYTRLLHDTVFIRSLINTLIYGIVLVPVAIFLALVFAVILNEYVFGKGILRLSAECIFNGCGFCGLDDFSPAVIWTYQSGTYVIRS